MPAGIPVPQPEANPDLQGALSDARAASRQDPSISREIYDGAASGFGPTLVDSIGNERAQIHATDSFILANHNKVTDTGKQRKVEALSAEDTENDTVTITRQTPEGDSTQRVYEGEQAKRLIRPLSQAVVEGIKQTDQTDNKTPEPTPPPDEIITPKVAAEAAGRVLEESSPTTTTVPTEYQRTSTTTIPSGEFQG